MVLFHSSDKSQQGRPQPGFWANNIGSKAGSEKENTTVIPEESGIQVSSLWFSWANLSWKSPKNSWSSLHRALILSLALGLTACAGGPFGQGLEQSLEPDPRLVEETEESDGPADQPTSNSSDEAPNESDGETGSDDAETAEDSENSSDNSPDSSSDVEEPDGEAIAEMPQPGDPDFVGPVARSPDSSPSDQTAAQSFNDLARAPEELQPFVRDLAALGLLKRDGSATELKPNQAITRREYARWLVTANNAFYADRPDYRIRLGVNSFKPAFQDVPITDPDFPVIQGLAEAGLIPSPLSGSTTAVQFRPDAPLTRENLILWKVPLDSRQPLPSASVEAVEKVWSFQDVAQIEPRALQAVLADHQNGEFANIRRTFGFTTLFQPKKATTRAEAAAVLWRFGNLNEGISAPELLATDAE